MLSSLRDPGSSNGRTPGFGPGNRGSNPCPGTKKPSTSRGRFFVIMHTLCVFLLL